jgi:tetratricopeptide (TPR) repeat protein
LIYIDQILAIDPDNFEALTLKGYVYEIQQDYVKAHRYYDQVLKLDPTNTKALSQKAHAYDLEGKLVQSEELYKAALKKTPVSEEVIVRYSRILLSKGKIGDAQLLLQENINSIKNNRLKSETYYLLGNFLQTDTYKKEAYDYFVLAQEADPTYAMSLVGLSQEKFKLGLDDTSGNRDSLFNEALELLSQALKLNPNQSLASLELARQAISMGNLEFGMKVLKNTLVNLENDITLGSGEKVWLKSVINDLINEYK